MKARPITWTGLIIGMIALLLIGNVPFGVSLAVGTLGIAISVIALLTSRN